MRRVETRLRRVEGDNGMENVGLHDLPCSTAQHSTATAASHLRRKSISLDGQLQGNGPLNSFIIIRRQAHSGLGFSLYLSLLSSGSGFGLGLRLCG